MLYSVGMHGLCDPLLLSYKGTFLKETSLWAACFRVKFQLFLFCTVQKVIIA